MTPVISETTVQDILSRHEAILKEADKAFKGYVLAHSLKIACGPGCYDCCPCNVSVNFLESYYLWLGMKALEPPLQQAIRQKAITNAENVKRLEPLVQTIVKTSGASIENARGVLSYLLRRKIVCQFVGENGRCLVYTYRPLICRVFGIPVKTWDEGEEVRFCEINTPKVDEGRPPLNVLRLQEEVDELSRSLELLLTGKGQPEGPIWAVPLSSFERLIKGEHLIRKDVIPNSSRKPTDNRGGEIQRDAETSSA